MSEEFLETSLDLLAWRGMLARAGSRPTADDLAEWAALLASAGPGAAAAAALFRDVAALHQGFSPQARAARAGGRPFGTPVPTPGETGLSRAVAELRALGRAFGTSGLGVDQIGRSGLSALPSSIDITHAAGRLRAMLDGDADDGAGGIEALTSMLAAFVLQAPPLDQRNVAYAPLAVLAPAIAAAGLASWTSATRDLWKGTRGLMRRAARFDAAGLGPYLLNVGRLARASRDVFDFARVAAEAAAETGGEASIEPWIGLLARGCRDGLLLEIVDDLGDLDARVALRVILARATYCSPADIDFSLLARLRDVGLDNADHALALEAQRVIARLRPHSDLEAMILGEIEASAGERGAAAVTFRHRLSLSPDHHGLRERLSALEAGRFEPFLATRGFGSPGDRQVVRLRRRGIAPNGRRLRGERVAAVQVR